MSTNTTDHADAAAPVKTQADLLDHEYDGIREFDNPTPSWWHAIFFATVLFSLIYYFFFTFSNVAWTPHDQLKRLEVAEYKKVFGRLGDLAPDEPTIKKMMKDEQMMSIAQGMFAGNCASCHGSDGGGINGVNLCDNNYKNVKQITDMFDVIAKGANAGAMPAQENRYSVNERVLLAAYAAKLRGTKPATPRPPEGDVIPGWDDEGTNE